VVIAASDLSPMSGLELLWALRQEQGLQDIPFLLLIMEATREAVVEAKHAGASACLIKPFTGGMLKAQLQQLCPRS
jgi:two-component system chemotaxis response regulator CheY